MTSGSASDRLALVSAGDTYSAADWEKATAAVLRKSGRMTEADPDTAVWDKLTRTTLDGIAVAPIGTPAGAAEAAPTGVPGAAPFTRGRLAEKPEIGWDIRAHFSGLAAKALNEAALLDLENGVNSLWLQVGGTLAPADLGAALQGVFLDLAPVTIDAPEDPIAAAEAYVALLTELDVTPAEGTNLGADPIGAQVRGEGAISLDVVDAVAALARRAGTLGVVVDGSALHDQGASDAQELGYSLAVGAAYLRRLVAAGAGIDEALALIEFRYAATAEQFPTIAKFRAARRLWARVAELSGASAAAGGQRQHAVTSRPMMAKYDPYVNMLRTTVAAFAAGVGGAEAITVLPFDEPLGQPSVLGRRNARNTSSLLISESHLAKVADPAGGSYAVERLTDDLARAGWEEFGRIEAAGGIVAALEDGSLLARVEKVVEAREAEIARRKRPLTGVSEFPNLSEELPERAVNPDADEVRRYGASFEALRDEPANGRVFLATLGSVASHTARATFASNLFAAGGIAVDVAGATADVDALVAAYDGQAVVCLAGADKTYAAWGAAAAEALRAAGARRVILAGKPGESTVAADLIDDSCAVGVNALEFLTNTRESLS
ncbi:methylmalonyl-CoA mutase family protein [Nocardioides daejeonensis]|uniref:methylmalonyl-CoA mutase family protein n=1 Tax=Nocardioides daejeonensis TaxID=1046556 RepID=UPI000D74B26E|nr:methylmalonyl-CoA mutase family protein [Nocardioides daejeonensis]